MRNHGFKVPLRFAAPLPFLQWQNSDTVAGTSDSHCKDFDLSQQSCPLSVKLRYTIYYSKSSSGIFCIFRHLPSFFGKLVSTEHIPVLGDSERVFVVEFQETKIDVAQGNIDLDSTHKQIVDIMEGGKEAFDKRQLIYTSWH